MADYDSVYFVLLVWLTLPTASALRRPIIYKMQNAQINVGLDIGENKG
jgi:hypothetical protein